MRFAARTAWASLCTSSCCGTGRPRPGRGLFGFFLVAGELDGDMRCAPGDGGLDALLVLAVTQLHERLLVQAQPRDAALLRSAQQGAGRETERAALREANELIARLGPLPARRHAAALAQVRRQQRTQQAQAELAPRYPPLPLRV